jgi:hypothetical protein
LKQRLGVYFDPDTMQPLPLNEWFNLRPLDLFEKAFEKLPILRRIWIRLTGKYESFRGRYLGQSTSFRPNAAGNPAGGGGGETSSSGRQDPRRSAAHRDDPRRRGGVDARGHASRGGSSSGGRRSSSGSAEPSRAAAATAAAKRAYSKKQVDSAWDEFGSTIKKGP